MSGERAGDELFSGRELAFRIEATDGDARIGVVSTRRGAFTTPCFMPVGTRGAVKAVSASDLEEIGFQVMLANTYHLMLRPGTDVVEEMGGVHGFSTWQGHVLTDSGGFQVYSLPSRYDDDGVSFSSVYDGSPVRLTPEDAVLVQARLGADIQMVLDVCAPLPSSKKVLRQAMETTFVWSRRAKRVHRDLLAEGRSAGALFGIVQGGDDPVLRAESARMTCEEGFDGYGIGGLSVGEPPEARRAALAAAVGELPRDSPRYLMGVGDPAGIVEAVSAGVDMFDCVLPTRLARHGTVLTSKGRISLRRSACSRDPGPIDDECACPVCGRWSRSFLRHLLAVGDPSALRLLSLHNLTWTKKLVDRVRQAVREGTTRSLLAEVSELYPPASPGRRDPLG
jgi:queuine tRNA-ribosyltransferase